MLRHCGRFIVVVAFNALLIGPLQAWIATSDPAAQWRGAKVMPKDGCVVKVGNKEINSQTWRLPWTVYDADGQRLRVGERERGWVERGQVLTLDEAVPYFTDAIRRNPQDWWAYYHRAMTWQNKGDLDQAVADFNQIIRINPTATSYGDRAYAWWLKKDLDKALADYNEAVRLDPKSVWAYTSRGEIWCAKQEYDKAIADFDQVILLDPNYVRAFLDRGRALSSKKEYDRAVASFDEAIRLDPSRCFRFRRPRHRLVLQEGIRPGDRRLQRSHPPRSQFAVGLYRPRDRLELQEGLRPGDRRLE